MHQETEGVQQSAKLYFHIDTSGVSIIALLSPRRSRRWSDKEDRDKT